MTFLKAILSAIWAYFYQTYQDDEHDESKELR